MRPGRRSGTSGTPSTRRTGRPCPDELREQIAAAPPRSSSRSACPSSVCPGWRRTTSSGPSPSMPGKRGCRVIHLHQRQGHGAARGRTGDARQHHGRLYPGRGGGGGAVRRTARAHRRLPHPRRRRGRQRAGGAEGRTEDGRQVAGRPWLARRGEGERGGDRRARPARICARSWIPDGAAGKPDGALAPARDDPPGRGASRNGAGRRSGPGPAWTATTLEELYRRLQFRSLLRELLEGTEGGPATGDSPGNASAEAGPDDRPAADASADEAIVRDGADRRSLRPVDGTDRGGRRSSPSTPRPPASTTWKRGWSGSRSRSHPGREHTSRSRTAIPGAPDQLDEERVLGALRPVPGRSEAAQDWPQPQVRHERAREPRHRDGR